MEGEQQVRAAVTGGPYQGEEVLVLGTRSFRGGGGVAFCERVEGPRGDDGRGSRVNLPLNHLEVHPRDRARVPHTPPQEHPAPERPERAEAARGRKRADDPEAARGQEDKG